MTGRKTPHDPDTPMPPEIPAVYDHVRADGSEVDAGIYRVVGVDEEGIRLLRVGDERGSRIHTGIVVDIDRATYASLDRADNPDDGLDRVGLVLLLAGVGLVGGVSVAGIGPVVGVDESRLLTLGVVLAVLGTVRLRR